MVLRLLLFSFVLLACERIPDWERHSSSGVSKDRWEAFHALRPWLWTCRGKQVQYRLGDGGSLVGLEIENFLDQFRASGLSVVDTSGLKTLMGTAFLWDREGHLLTLYHWVEQSSEIECRNATSNWTEVKLVGEDRPLNLALLKLNNISDHKDLEVRPSWVAASKGPGFDDEVYIVTAAFPGALDQIRVYPEIFREKLYTGLDDELVLFQPSPPALFRGGLLVNERAEIYAYLFQKSSEAWGAGLRMKSLRELVNSMISGGKISRAHLGMRVRYTKERGFLIQEVEIGGPAYKAGLRVQDELISWNSKQLTQFSDWPIITFKDIGHRITVVYRRDNKEIQTELEVGASF